ncbi:MAG TPA: hypothetical protein VNT22_04670 [Baekduia sp.]|nr:hypothetical protein [Baekduia sp.]
MLRRLVTGLVLIAAAGGALVALGDSDDRVPLVKAPQEVRTDIERAKRAVKRETRKLPAPPCAAGVPDCGSVSGRIIYVEAVDPDGDGDLHVVVADGSITLPGLTSIDVRPGLRPQRDPRVGDRAAASGPIQIGSKQQRQIHALNFSVLPR